MKQLNQNLSEALGIEPIEVVEKKQEILEPVPETSLSNDAESDYTLARQTFRNLIVQGNLAMEDMKELEIGRAHV